MCEHCDCDCRKDTEGMHTAALSLVIVSLLVVAMWVLIGWVVYRHISKHW